MILDTSFPGDHSIIGTDIDHAALKLARAPTFADADIACLPRAYQDAYLECRETAGRRSRPLQKYVTFERHNLLSEDFESDFDLIICRNVVIYFTAEAKDTLFRRFFDALAPGGYLWVGSTERLPHAEEVGYQTPYPFFYRKPSQKLQVQSSIVHMAS